MLSLGERQGEPRIPVVIEIDKNRLRELGQPGAGGRARHDQEAGTRGGAARPASSTELHHRPLLIGLDLIPDSPMELSAQVEDEPYPEIPTLPTRLEQAAAKFQAVLTVWKRWTGKPRPHVDEHRGRSESPGQFSRGAANLVALRGALTEIRKTPSPLREERDGRDQRAARALQRLQAAIDRIDAIADPKAPLVQGLTGRSATSARPRARPALAEDSRSRPERAVEGKSAMNGRRRCAARLVFGCSWSRAARFSRRVPIRRASSR